MRLHSLAVSVMLMSAGLPAFADNIDLTFAEATGSATVSLNAGVNYGNGQYLITSASGSINGLAIVSLVAPGGYPSSSVDVPNDNLLSYPLNSSNPAYFDNNGISFLLFGGEYFNVYAEGTTYYDVTGVTPIDVSPREVITALSVTQSGPLPAPVPEPSALATLALGLVGVATLRRLR